MKGGREGEGKGRGEGEALYSAIFARHFAVNFLCQSSYNIGHIIAIPVVFHTGK